MKKPFVLIIFVVSIVVALVVVQVVVSNKLSTEGTLLGKLSDEIKLYKHENSVMKEHYLFASSLTRVASRAAELGLVKEKSVVYFNTPLPIALR